MKYSELTIWVDQNLGLTVLVEAATRLGPALVYDLYVHPSQLVWARGFMRDLACHIRNNPFAPYVNIHTCEEFRRDEWCLAIGERAYGSKGI